MIYEEIENFLDEKYFQHLYDKITKGNNQFPWLFQGQVAYKGDPNDDAYYFVHSVFDNHQPYSRIHNDLEGVYNALGVKALIRTRVLMYTNQGRQIVHSPHVDFSYSHKAALLYMNTNNGYTLMADEGVTIEASQTLDDIIFVNGCDGTDPFTQQNKSMSVRNKCTIHDGARPHCSSTCTDAKSRILIAINYF